MAILDYALGYAARGWPVFPLEPGGKRPAGALVPHGLKEATTDQDIVRAWWAKLPRANIACPTGFVFDALDADTNEAIKAFIETCQFHDVDPYIFPRSKTASGKRHVLVAPTGEGNRAKFLPGTDWRGKGGYIVMPGSVVDGNAYEWVSPPNGHGFPPAPEWLLEVLRKPEPTPPAAVTTTEPTSTYVDRAVEDEMQKLRSTPVGARNDQLNRSAFALGTMIGAGWLDQGRAEAELRAAAFAIDHGKEPGLSATIRSGIESGKRNPRSGLAPTDQARISPAPITPDGEIVTPSVTLPNLPTSFWEARPSLKRIRDTAHGRLVSPDVVLAAVLARLAAAAPHKLKIPPIVGAPGSLNFIAGLTGAPGTGKSVAQSIASWLIPFTDDTKGPLPIGSGEGLAEAYWGWIEDEENPKKKKHARTHYSAFVTADEGQVITALNDRSGSTITATLRSVFTGGDIGQQNAAQERRRIVAAGTYSAGVAVNLQPDACGPIFEGAGLGTPQRIYFASSTDPTIPDDATSDSVEPMLSSFVQERFNMTRAGLDIRWITYPKSVKDEVRAARLPVARGQQCDDMAAHHDLFRLKLAALLALLEERFDVNEEDWQLATVAKSTSDTVRDAVRALLAGQIVVAERNISRRYAAREVDKLEAIEARTARKTVECAERIRDKVKSHPGVTVAEVRRQLWKWGDVFPAAKSHAVAEGWIVEEEEDGTRGQTKRVLRPPKDVNGPNLKGVNRVNR